MRRSGVVTFAGVLFIVVGLFNIIDGIAALTRDTQFYVGENALIIQDYDAWGAALLVVGALITLVGLGILSGSKTAEVLGVILAGLNFIGQLALFQHYPAWSITVMVLDVIVIYALTVHSDEFGKTVR